MIQIDPELGVELEKELRRGWHMNRIEAEIEAKRIGKINEERPRAIEGLGQLTARIPATAYHFWGQKLGYECWNDKTFMREFLRDNEACKVNSRGTKDIHVGWVPSNPPKSRTVYK